MKTIYFEKDIPRILATKFAAKHCKPMLYGGLNAVKFKTDLPDPPLPAGDWVRVKNIACGLCGTDISFFKATTGTNSAFEPIPGSKRTYLGHENVGVVTEVGSEVTDFKVGDRVTIRAYMSGCDTKGIRDRCPYCEAGDYNFCLNYGAPSPYDLPDTGAGWGDSFIYPARGLAHIYDELTDEQAVMVEPTCVSIHSVLCAPPQKGEKVLVMGCGAIGLGVVQAAVEKDQYVLGNVEDQYTLGTENVLSGLQYEWGSVLETIFADIKSGAFLTNEGDAKTYWINVANSGLSMTELNDVKGRLTDEEKATIETVYEQLHNDEIDLPEV